MSSGGTFQTEIGLDHSLGTSRRAKRPQRLEDVEFAFDVAGPSPMPVVNVDDVLDTVLKDTAFPSQESHLVCDALFRSKSCRNIIQDTFWWARDALLLDEEDRSQEVQKQLFDRISDNYVALLMRVPPERTATFFERFWDVLAQCVYRSFVEAFPKSFVLFGDAFKRALIDACSTWCNGIVPSKPSFKHWPADPTPTGSSATHSMAGHSLAASLGTEHQNASDARGTGTTTWMRAASSLTTLGMSPMMSNFMAHERTKRLVTHRMKLSHAAERPLVPRKPGAAPQRRLKVVRSQAEAVIAATDRRSAILHEYQAQREKRLRKIGALRRAHASEQELAKTKAMMVLTGDVQEYSNYLASLNNND